MTAEWLIRDDEETQAEVTRRKHLTDTYQAHNIALTEEQEQFIAEKLSSKLWRMNNLYTILDKDGNKRILKLNAAQLKTLTKFRHNKKIILKSRQQGISTLYLAYNLDDCLFKPGYQAGIQSYGLDESEKLSRRAELMWNELDLDVKTLFNLEIDTNNSKGMSFSNGSILKIGNFRGDTLQSLHVSELAKIAKKFPDKAKELKTGAFQAVGKNNKITVESTAEGKSGLFYEMWMKAVSIEKRGLELGPFDFQAIFLSWLDDPDCNIDMPKEISEELAKYFAKIEEDLSVKLADTQKWWYASKLDELGEDMKQEYPTTAEEAFEQSVEGTYYKHEYKTLKISDNLYDENLKVHSALDLGMNDTFSMFFFQVHPDGKPKVVGEYANSGYGLQHYKDIIDALNKKFGWVYGNTYVPHDSKVRELIAAKTRWDAMTEMGFRPILVRKHSLVDGIEETRRFLKEVKIDSSCQMFVDTVQNYRKKYDEKFDVYLDSPVHDEWSHPADAIRYLAMGHKHNRISDIYVRTYNPRRATRIMGYDV